MKRTNDFEEPQNKKVKVEYGIIHRNEKILKLWNKYIPPREWVYCNENKYHMKLFFDSIKKDEEKIFEDMMYLRHRYESTWYTVYNKDYLSDLIKLVELLGYTYEIKSYPTILTIRWTQELQDIKYIWSKIISEMSGDKVYVETNSNFKYCLLIYIIDEKNIVIPNQNMKTDVFSFAFNNITRTKSELRNDIIKYGIGLGYSFQKIGEDAIDVLWN